MTLDSTDLSCDVSSRSRDRQGAGGEADPQPLLERLQRASRVPLGVHLQISDRCNHACKHCYQVQGNKGELTTAQWISALEQMARDGVLFLTVSGGEATLRKDLVEILKATRRLGFAVRLFTNGYLVDLDLARELADLHLLAIHVSVYSHVPEEHDGITLVPGSWRKTTSAIRELTSRGAHVVVKWIGLSGCSSTQAGMMALAESLHAILQSSTLVTAREDGNTSISREMMRAGDELIQLVGDTRRTEPGSAADRLDQHPCGVCRTSIAVMPDGGVRGCTALQREIGNVSCVYLPMIADHPEFKLLSELRWRDVHGCRDCDVSPYCARCHADALLQAGDLLGPYAQACRFAEANYASEAGLEPLGLAEGARRVGPFRIDSGALRAVPDILTPADLALRAAHPWICKSPDQDQLARGCLGC